MPPLSPLPLFLMMTSVQKPSLWRALSDASRIIRSNSLHFVALSLLFIFPVSLLNLIYIQTLQPATPLHSHYRRLLSAVSAQNSDHEIPPLDKSQIHIQFLYGLLVFIFNLCSTASVTHSTFHGFDTKTQLKLSTSLKSILSSFFPLLATKLAYIAIMAVVVFGFGIFMGFTFMGLVLIGFEIEPSSKPFMAVALTATVLLFALFVYLGLKWFFFDTVAVVESEYGFTPFERSAKLVKGGRGAALLMMVLFSILGAVVYSALGGRGSGGGGCSAGVAVKMVAYTGFSTALLLLSLATKTVLFVQCKEFNGESSELLPSYDKMGEVYVPLPVDDQV